MKLGQSKEDKWLRQFTMIHNTTALAIIQAAGPDAFCLWFLLNTYLRGKTGVFAYPKNGTLAQQLSASERSVQRWKSRLQQVGIVRVIPCFLPGGTQTANVVVINAEYPDVPKEWKTFAQHGFCLVGGTPIPLEQLTKPEIGGVTKVSPHPNGPRQNGRPSQQAADSFVRGRVTDLSPSSEPANPVSVRDEEGFLAGEPNVLELNKEEEAASNSTGEPGIENERCARGDGSEMDDRIQRLEVISLELLQRSTLGPEERSLLRQLLVDGVQEDVMERGIRESFQLFKPKYEGDRIKRLTYCRDRILELHAHKSRAICSYDKDAQAQTGQRNTQKRTDAHTTGRDRAQSKGTPFVQSGKYDRFRELYRQRDGGGTDDRVVPAAQPGKYDRFYEAYPHLRKPEEHGE